jgi:hypothetical protein
MSDTRVKKISGEDLDRMFDDGEDVSAYFDVSTATRVSAKPRRVNVDFPDWMVRSLDAQAHKRGVTRQALIKIEASRNAAFDGSLDILLSRSREYRGRLLTAVLHGAPPETACHQTSA